MNQRKDDLREGANGASRTHPDTSPATDTPPLPSRALFSQKTQSDLKTRINESDTQHLIRFPAAKKMRVMARIMALTPLSCDQRTESHHYEKAMLRLRSEGFELIDMQPLETALTTVWYRRNGRFALGLAAEQVKMVVWESQNDRHTTTTVISWQI